MYNTYVYESTSSKMPYLLSTSVHFILQTSNLSKRIDHQCPHLFSTHTIAVSNLLPSEDHLYHMVAIKLE